jgi:hypothetical protein
MKRPTWLLVGLFLLFCAVPSKADNRIIVRTTLGLSGLQQLCLLQICSAVGGLGDPLNQLFLITTPLDATTFLNLLRPLPGIVDAELDQLLSLLGGLNVVPTPLLSGLMSDRSPFDVCGSTVWNSYANQPAATIVQVPTAQPQFCGAGVVADIDTGVDPNHPAFAGVLLTGYDFTRNQQGASELNDINPSDFPTYPPPPCSSTTCPSAATVNQSSAAILDQSSAAILDGNVKYAAFGHGTMVLGVVHLVAPKASLLPLKAFHADGTGYLSDVVRAIYYAVNNGANVVNMSFDFATDSQELTSALAYANQSSLIGIASVGNNGQKEIVYPAALQSDVMGVASTNDLDVRSSFSDYGDAIVWVAAPGEAIITTYPFDTYAAGWGTSFSAPFVSGASALLLNKQSKINYSQAAAAIAHAVPVGPDMGNGRLAIAQALQASSSADFVLSVSPATSTVNAGQSAIYTVTVTPLGGFDQQVSLSCSGMPAASTCTIAPSTVMLNGTAPATATLVVQTTARAAAAAPRFFPIGTLPGTGIRFSLYWLLYIGSFALWLRLSRSGRASRCQQASPAVVGLVAISLILQSCSSGSSNNGTPSSPASDGVSISSIVVNPTSVNGGSSSTGTVTLAAPAPSGGAVISLSSSNTMAATVPGSVTLAAGSANATFQIATMPVAASTSVTVSASHPNTATQTASLMVTPAASGPKLTSLSLNPTTVTGGSSATGGVTLSATAPSGGATVSLASSATGVATVPAQVTVPAGATGATFTVSSTTVTTTTSVTISASYAGVTENNSLTVTTPSSSGTPAGTYSLTISASGGGLSHSTTANLVVN